MVVKISYTRKAKPAKANVGYIEHRPGKDGAKIIRTLFNADGKMERIQAYQMIDQAEEGSIFFRIIISPDPQKEDTNRDLSLREITEKTMHVIEDKFQKHIQWVAAEHIETDNRHTHVLAIVPGGLYSQDLQLIRTRATEEALQQRRERDLIQEQRERTQQHKEKEAEWEY